MVLDTRMVFQEAMTALNPVLTIGRQIAEVVELHRKLNRRDALVAAVQMLGRVGIPDPVERARFVGDDPRLLVRLHEA